MSEESKSSSAAPESTVSDSAQENQDQVSASGGNDTVKYDTYKRTLGEAKKYKSEVETLKSRLSELEQSQLSAEGKKDELIDSLKKQNNDLNSKLSQAVGNFAKSKVHEVMMSEASKLGCQDPELLIRAYGSDLDAIDFDDSFNPDREQIIMTLNKVKTERPFLFSKPGPKVANHNLNPDGIKDPEPKVLSKMDTNQLMEAWSKAQK